MIVVHCAYAALEPLARLLPHPRNPNKHPPRQLDLLSAAIKQHGWRNPIVVSRQSGYVVAGHARLLAAQQLGETHAPVDWQEFASNEEELAHLLADNQLAEFAELDMQVVSSVLFDLQTSEYDLTLTGFDDTLLGTGIVVGVPNNILQPIERGQVWRLGEHRVMCGDSHNDQDVAKLMAGEKAGLVFGEVVTDLDLGSGDRRTPLPANAPNVVMYSGGKDSLAMLLLMREHGVKVDHVVSVKMGSWEWPELEAHHAKVELELGIQIEWVDVSEKLDAGFAKYGFPQVFARWCNTLKVKSLTDHVKRRWGGADNIRQFIGIAYDERERLYRKHYSAEHAAFPLVEHKVTEAQALAMCKAAGFDFGGIYERQHRVSCWCCPLSRDSYILDLCVNDKPKWEVLREMQARSCTPFKLPYKSIYWFEHALWSRYQRKSESKAVDVAWRLAKSDERIGGDVDEYLKENSPEGAVVFCADGFSAEVVLACGRTGRKCRAMELAPENAQAVLDAWAKATGGTPELLP